MRAFFLTVTIEQTHNQEKKTEKNIHNMKNII